MDNDYNLILDTDGYKPTHGPQFPPGTKGYSGYISARRADAVCYGMQMHLIRYLSKPITEKHIDEADEYFADYFNDGTIFNRKGWEYILDKYHGYIPVTIKCAPEGMIIPKNEVMITIESTDPECYWVAPYLETALVRLWYPSTVATYSRECKKILLKYLEMSSDNPRLQLPIKLHDFGGRGCECWESSGIGGSAHLVNFVGSDTCTGAKFANKYYNIKMSSHSIAAMEHGTVTSHGKEHEIDAYRQMLQRFGKPGKVIACVSDSYDIFNACEKIWGEQLREEVIKSGAYVVVRPDSGSLPETPIKCMQILESKYGSIVNKKGYKVLKNVGVIQGDYMDIHSLETVCASAVEHGFSLDSLNFGMGGALIQKHDRDELGFAMKCSATLRNGRWIDAFKEPVGDPLKKSRAGRISLYKTGDGNYVTMRIEDAANADVEEVLRPVFVNGKLMNMSTFDEVRQRASL